MTYLYPRVQLSCHRQFDPHLPGVVAQLWSKIYLSVLDSSQDIAGRTRGKEVFYGVALTFCHAGDGRLYSSPQNDRSLRLITMAKGV